MYQNDRILLVDDEQGLLDMLAAILKKEHFTEIYTAATASQALELVQKEQFDLILLDVMLPDFSGFDLCSEIRRHSFAPIIFVSACDTDLDKLTGLTVGGDDYITKPFNPLEVVARIKAILRRQKQYSHKTAEQHPTAFDYGVFALDLTQGVLRVNGDEVECTAKEFELLHFFCENPGRVFTTTQLYEAVWDELGLGDEKTVAMHISRLRKRIEDTTPPTMILNLRGIGYKFVPPNKGDE